MKSNAFEKGGERKKLYALLSNRYKKSFTVASQDSLTFQTCFNSAIKKYFIKLSKRGSGGREGGVNQR